MQQYVSAFRALPTLQTPRLTLRMLSLKDAPDMYAYAKDPAVSRHVLWDTHRSIADSRAFIRAAKRQYSAGLPATFAIVDKTSGRVIGTIGFMWVNLEFHSAEVGYSLAQSAWNKGLMTEALSAVIAYGFDALRLNRIEAQHDLSNPASGRVMEKCGMRREGTLRARVFNKGQFEDMAVYAILRSDPRPNNKTKENDHV